MNGDKLGYLCLVCFPGLWGQLKENVHVHHVIPMPLVVVGIDFWNTREPEDSRGLLCGGGAFQDPGLLLGPEILLR